MPWPAVSVRLKFYPSVEGTEKHKWVQQQTDAHQRRKPIPDPPQISGSVPRGQVLTIRADLHHSDAGFYVKIANVVVSLQQIR